MHVKNTKTIIDSTGHEWSTGRDVCFTLLRDGRRSTCFGVITEINDEDFTITDIELNKVRIKGTLTIKYKEVAGGNFNPVFYD